MSVSAIMWKVSTTAYNAISIRQEIEHIWESIGEIYSDISKAHVNSALQAIGAAEHSKFHEHGILDAISHLRDAYNICDVALHKTRTVWLILDEDLIPKNDRNEYCVYLAHLAGVISILYKSLNEHQTAGEWKNKAIERFESGFDISIKELEMIDSSFADITCEEMSYADGCACYIAKNESISGEGYRYIDAQRLLKTKEFGESIDQRILELKPLVNQ